MPRLREFSHKEADPSCLPLFDALFGKDRDPVSDPGTATGTPGNWWTVLALVRIVFIMRSTGFNFTDRKRENLRLITESLVKHELGIRVVVSLFFPSTARHCELVASPKIKLLLSPLGLPAPVSTT